MNGLQSLNLALVMQIVTNDTFAIHFCNTHCRHCKSKIRKIKLAICQLYNLLTYFLMHLPHSQSYYIVTLVSIFLATTDFQTSHHQKHQ